MRFYDERTAFALKLFPSSQGGGEHTRTRLYFVHAINSEIENTVGSPWQTGFHLGMSSLFKKDSLIKEN